MALLKNGKLSEDPYTRIQGDDALPDHGAIVVDLARWKKQSGELISREDPLGIRLASDEAPDEIAADLEYFALIELEFPAFTDGRAYSHARLLRERHHFEGELRAVGDVLIEQLHFMHRTGFSSFEISSEHAEEDWAIAEADMKVWYQPTGDGRKTAGQLRRR